MFKKIKKILACMLAFFCFFAVAGCAPSDPADPTEPETPQGKTEAEIYTVLRTHATNAKVDVDTTQTTTAVVEGLMANNTEMDTSNSGLDEASIEGLKAMMGEMLEGGGMGSRQEYVYKTDGTGYVQNLAYNSETEKYDIVESLNRTTKSGDVYTNYLYEAESSYAPEVKRASKVDDKYALNTYVLDANELLGEDSAISGLIDSLKQYEALADFKDNIDELTGTLMGDAGSVFGELPEQGVTISLKFEEKDSGYAFVATVEIDEMSVSAAEMGMPGDAEMSATASLVVNFTDNGIKSATMGIDATTAVSMKTKDLTDGMVSDETKFIVLNVETKMDTSYAYGATIENIDETLALPVEGYTGTGEEGAIENRITEVEFNYVGVNSAFSREFGFGEVINTEDLVNEHGLDVLGFYWDKECTQEVGAEDTYPSYDCTIYVKVKPAEGYAIVNTEIYNSDYGYTLNRYNVYNVSEESSVLASELIYNGTLLTKVVVNGEEKTLTEGDYTLTLEANKVYNVVITVTELED